MRTKNNPVSDSPDVPPTEPADTPAATPPAIASPTTIAGTRLAPEIIGPEQIAPRFTADTPDEQFWYWVGALPAAPMNCLHVAGIEFPKTNRLVFLHTTTKEQVDQEQVGCLMRLTRAQVRKLAEQLPRKVVRYVPDPTESAKEAEIRESEGRPRSGTLLTVWPKEELEKSAKNGTPLRAHVPRVGDLPVADLVYAVWIDEVSPGPRWIGTPLPKPLSATGLAIPPVGARAVPHTEKVGLARDDGYVVA